MTVSLPDLKSLTDKKTKKVWIKDGMRKMMTDTGYMKTPADMTRKMFGRLKGGKYSQTQ